MLIRRNQKNVVKLFTKAMGTSAVAGLRVACYALRRPLSVAALSQLPREKNSGLGVGQPALGSGSGSVCRGP